MRAHVWTWLLLGGFACGVAGCVNETGNIGAPASSGAPSLGVGRSDASTATTATSVTPAAPITSNGLTFANPTVTPKQQPAPQSGQVTAGSFDDNGDVPAFHRFLHKFRQDNSVAGLPARFLGRHVTITVKDGAGQPVGDARITVRAGNTTIALRSRTDGRAIVVTPWDGLPKQAAWTVAVAPADGALTVTQPCPANMDRLNVVLPGSRNLPTRILDLALVVDCTGSMGDELEYLKSEMKSIAMTIKAKFPQVKQRYALIAYRDAGDEYVTRTFPFTESLDKLVANIKAQRADGGGDLPESVEKAMAEAEKLQWTAGPAARVLIHLADAPPHTADFEASLKSVDHLRRTGVAIYPVACSGYDAGCELHMRASALLTGGQFLFLTDDSGIGDAHAEPKVPGYRVERLNALLVRMVASEIAGRRIEPSPGEILRTVGKTTQVVQR